MSITKKNIMSADGVAVFTRGHQDQLKEAEQREADAITTFRSQISWRSAENALNWRSDNILVYYCPIGEGEDKIQYSAVLNDILVNPEEEDERVDEFLETDLEVHRQHDDGLWEQYGGVNTLYRVTQFRAIEDSFSFTELRKISDGVNIDPDYGYSYSLVHQR